MLSLKKTYRVYYDYHLVIIKMKLSNCKTVTIVCILGRVWHILSRGI